MSLTDPLPRTTLQSQGLVKDSVARAFVFCGKFLETPVDEGRYLAWAALTRLKKIQALSTEAIEVGAFGEWYKFLAGTQGGAGKVSEMGATQQVHRHLGQLRKVINPHAIIT